MSGHQPWKTLTTGFIRNFQIYDSARPTEPLGGLYLNPSCPYSVWFQGVEHQLSSIDDPLEPGHYYIVCDIPGGVIGITDERCIARSFSRTVSKRDSRFRDQVLNRDRKCVITGIVNRAAYRNEWTSFETAHIFPLAHEELFIGLNYPRYVTLLSGENGTGIKSCQNGLLMQSHIHMQFDSLSFTIDPNDNYKITCFSEDHDEIDGRFLDPSWVIDEFLRWHFRQAPVFESDFPDGSDMVGEILSGPRAAERMEAELFSRLNRISPVA
ncbi:hypothetical protein V1525DRAFT_407358 [Lipomyces kononenkoae]|uniref:Uncharacterized protein n=1 Tax=Lipomyces kononenkoae TaxID=34357 RepID=A0ACC3SY52_LIPKO